MLGSRYHLENCFQFSYHVLRGIFQLLKTNFSEVEMFNVNKCENVEVKRGKNVGRIIRGEANFRSY